MKFYYFPSMKKLLFLIMISLPFLYSCGSGCEGGYGAVKKNYYSANLYFIDSSNKFIKIVNPLVNKISKFDYPYRHYCEIKWEENMKFLDAQKPVSIIIIEHKKGIDTISFEFIKNKLKYDIDECSGPYVNLSFEGPFVKSFTFKSVYSQNGFLMIEQ